jgi:hypothetical protein
MDFFLKNVKGVYQNNIKGGGKYKKGAGEAGDNFLTIVLS